MKLKHVLPVGALIGGVIFAVTTADYWRAPQRTLAEIPFATQGAAWERKVHGMLPEGTTDRDAEAILRTAGFIVAGRSNFAYLLMEDGSCIRWLSVRWDLDAGGVLRNVRPDASGGCT